MAIKLLENCDYSLGRIERLWIGSRQSNGQPLQYPIEFNTVTGSGDSIIAVEYDEFNQTFTIGNQIIEVNEITSLGENLRFTEVLERNQNGKQYVKKIDFNIPNVNLYTTNRIKEFVMTSEGNLALAKTIAFILDENGETLCVGYDNPLKLMESNTDVNTTNQYELIYISRSGSRARKYQIV